jgi:signal transduction histidine kinase
MRMITNLLDIGRADEGQLAPVRSAVDPRALVAEVVDEMTARAVAASVELVSEIDAAPFRADADLVQRVLANLIENAIRHAPAGTAVRVRVTRVGGEVELRVIDAGPGVPIDQRPHVFERFVRGDHAARTNRGLGLAFCKLAIEAHGGRIWIEDAEPGAVFCARIPDAQ